MQCLSFLQPEIGRFCPKITKIKLPNPFNIHIYIYKCSTRARIKVVPCFAVRLLRRAQTTTRRRRRRRRPAPTAQTIAAFKRFAARASYRDSAIARARSRLSCGHSRRPRGRPPRSARAGVVVSRAISPRGNRGIREKFRERARTSHACMICDCARGRTTGGDDAVCAWPRTKVLIMRPALFLTPTPIR